MVEGAEGVVANLAAWGERMLRAASEAAAEIAAFLEGYAKSHHPWTPRTGATDVSTAGSWGRLAGDLFEVILSAGMDYDVFLELAHDGKWSWLWPAIEGNRDEIFAIWTARLTAAME